MKKISEKLSGISAGILVSLCFSFILLCYAPFELYLTNTEDFWIRLENLVIPILVFFAAGFIGLSAAFVIARLINQKFYNVCLAVGTALTLSTYIQGNFLVKNLPPTDGTTVDWNAYPIERLKSIIVYVVPLIVFIFILIKFRGAVLRKIASIGSACLSLLLVVTLVSLAVTTDVSKPEAQLSTDKNVFLMSEDQNLVVFLLDAIDNTAIKKELENDPELKVALDGFTYYDNTASGYPYTSRSIPQMFSGKWYENDSLFADYQRGLITDSPVFDELEKQNYSVGFYNKINFGFEDQSEYERFDNFSPVDISYTSYEVYKYIFKMSGMKFLPWDLKAKSWNVYTYANHVCNPTSGDKIYSSDNRTFYSALKESNPITLSDEKCARLIYLDGAHVPFEYDKDFNEIDNPTYEDKIGACGTMIKAYLSRMKESGVYDNTAIVILGDHGYQGSDPALESLTEKRFNPALIVKGIDEKHEMQYSSAPISYADLADGFVKLVRGNAGDNIFEYKDGDMRERRILKLLYLDEEHMEEYIIPAGVTADDYNSFVKTGKVYDYKK